MKARKLRELTPDELRQQHDDARAELSNLQIRKGIRQLEQPSRLRTLRRDIARIKTIMREQQRAAK